MATSEYEVADRLLALIEMVDAGRPLRLREIVERYGVNEECARRYRDWIAEHRDLVEEREGRHKVWRLRPDQDSTVAAIPRAAALAFAVRALTELEGTEHYAQLDAMAEQARLALSEAATLRFERLARNLQVRSPGRSRNVNRVSHLRTLLAAIEDRRPCSLYYERADGEHRRYVIEPWGMFLNGGRVLVIAGKRGEGGRPVRRTFDVDGIHSMELLASEARFPPPADRHTDHEHMFRDAFGVYSDWPEPAEDVRIRVRGPHAVALRKRQVHPSQQLTDVADGWTELAMRVYVCPDLVSFVLSMLPDVRADAPASLRDLVKEAVERFSSS